MSYSLDSISSDIFYDCTLEKKDKPKSLKNRRLYIDQIADKYYGKDKKYYLDDDDSEKEIINVLVVKNIKDVSGNRNTITEESQYRNPDRSIYGRLSKTSLKY